MSRGFCVQVNQLYVVYLRKFLVITPTSSQLTNFTMVFDRQTIKKTWAFFCFFFVFFGATLTDLTLASKRPMRSMGPTGAQLFCIESTIPGRTCWYHCWAMAVELGAPLLRETAVIPGFAHYMRLYSLLAKPLFFTHTTTSRCWGVMFGVFGVTGDVYTA